jgi:outer membrane protein TolC
MNLARKLRTILLSGLLTVAGCYGMDGSRDHELTPPAALAAALAPAVSATPPDAAELAVVPAPQPDDRPLPINLPAALQLANVQAVDIAAATARIRVAAAQLEQAEVLWLPTITIGGDINRHDGRQQDSTGKISDNSRSSGMLGLGTGIGPAAILDVGQALFAPLYARQQVRARQADRQAAANNTIVAVSDAYFNVQQARGQLVGTNEAIRRTEDLVTRTRKLAPNMIPELELFRAETQLAHLREIELLNREQWKVASAELLRVLRLDPSAQVEPLEPPQLRIELIDLKKPVDELIPIGLTYRPELAAQQAQVQATLVLLKQERLRPLIPSLLLRGYSTPVTGTLGVGYFGGGPGSSFGNGALRSDFDLQVLFQLNNLGFGNRALVHQRQAENRLAVLELFRIEDRVAAEVAQAYAQAQLAARRVEIAEKGLRSAVLSADKNLFALKKTKGVGDQEVTIVRPQEVVAAIQALSQAYLDYFGAVADANRAQFRLYRALGQPAQYLLQGQQASALCTPVPSQVPTHEGMGDAPLPAPYPPPRTPGSTDSSGVTADTSGAVLGEPLPFR